MNLPTWIEEKTRFSERMDAFLAKNRMEKNKLYPKPIGKDVRERILDSSEHGRAEWGTVY